MTNKEAIDRLRHNESFDLEYREDCEAIGLALEALERAEKYRWHDLTKGIWDLPNEGEKVLVCGEHKGYEVGTFNGCHESRGYSVWEWEKHTVKKVIAWRYIEPFEEDKW